MLAGLGQDSLSGLGSTTAVLLPGVSSPPGIVLTGGSPTLGSAAGTGGSQSTSPVLLSGSGSAGSRRWSTTPRATARPTSTRACLRAITGACSSSRRQIPGIRERARGMRARATANRGQDRGGEFGGGFKLHRDLTGPTRHFPGDRTAGRFPVHRSRTLN